MCTQCSVQKEDVIEHTNVQVSFFIPLTKTCRSACNIIPHNIIKHTHAKVLVSALEHQMSSSDTNGEVVGQWCNHSKLRNITFVATKVHAILRGVAVLT
jgi:hypothetical protein